MNFVVDLESIFGGTCTLFLETSSFFFMRSDSISYTTIVSSCESSQTGILVSF